ncbi:unnamed protein product [Auanema sp. JU1783]|nr:unnamed protein product [Auanema sp. JU1783]
MLPKSVAECLKAGKGVVPEAYESVSILFSDIVSFTTISSSCSPWQVVQLLNDLYTKMDSVVKGFDVYKVETIGDCYMLVSGVPERNGTKHIKNICISALKLLEATSNIPLPHENSAYLELRVGIHTGPVVAGVVGLIMPRFCLFGDTVNTASRMESTGEASKVHLSPNANQLLKSTYPEFITECRGEIPVKGKGNMMTYWLTR